MYCFYLEFDLFDFRRVLVCLCVCVCAAEAACERVSLQHALFGLCLTSYLLFAPREALVSVRPCRAILPLTHAYSDLIGPWFVVLNHTCLYRLGQNRNNTL